MAVQILIKHYFFAYEHETYGVDSFALTEMIYHIDHMGREMNLDNAQIQHDF